MVEFRCSECNKLLGKAEGICEIKCTRCGKVNKFMYISDFLKDPENIKKYYVDVLKSQRDSTLVIDIIKQRQTERHERH